MEGLHSNLGLSFVYGGILFLVELKVVFNGLSGKLDLLGLSWGEAGSDGPVGNKNGQRGDQGEEDECLPSSTNFVTEVEGNYEEGTKKDLIGEGITPGTVCWKRSIGNCRIL